MSSHNKPTSLADLQKELYAQDKYNQGLLHTLAGYYKYQTLPSDNNVRPIYTEEYALNEEFAETYRTRITDLISGDGSELIKSIRDFLKKNEDDLKILQKFSALNLNTKDSLITSLIKQINANLSQGNTLTLQLSPMSINQKTIEIPVVALGANIRIDPLEAAQKLTLNDNDMVAIMKAYNESRSESVKIGRYQIEDGQKPSEAQKQRVLQRLERDIGRLINKTQTEKIITDNLKISITDGLSQENHNVSVEQDINIWIATKQQLKKLQPDKINEVLNRMKKDLWERACGGNKASLELENAYDQLWTKTFNINGNDLSFFTGGWNYEKKIIGALGEIQAGLLLTYVEYCCEDFKNFSGVKINEKEIANLIGSQTNTRSWQLGRDIMMRGLGIQVKNYQGGIFSGEYGIDMRPVDVLKLSSFVKEPDKFLYTIINYYFNSHIQNNYEEQLLGVLQQAPEILFNLQENLNPGDEGILDSDETVAWYLISGKYLIPGYVLADLLRRICKGQSGISEFSAHINHKPKRETHDYDIKEDNPYWVKLGNEKPYNMLWQPSESNKTEYEMYKTKLRFGATLDYLGYAQIADILKQYALW